MKKILAVLTAFITGGLAIVGPTLSQIALAIYYSDPECAPRAIRCAMSSN